ncbi:DgyrCDS3992 [Dimorphilus gyrociliatus]|uniref:DgyrCDS3992 n=1 Tax=Dimorphilus gyrociliatus TaxID=2664684 RepID=A0A7I8VFI3_9ANNE|nr:DgyrCDS3992 [Dimorphilus gyrociliatus]
MPNAKPEHKIRMGMGTWEEIWTPDVFFRNEKKASFHSISVPNRLLQIKPDGTLWYVSKISATLSCPMLLHNYPLDKQSCPIMFESFGYTMDTMYFAWLARAIEIDEDVELPQFTLEDQIKYDCSQNYTTGAYPCLEIRFILRRDIGYFLIQVYIPSMLIVILSWVAFWINIDAIPARVSLGLLTVLTMTTQSTGARSSLPRVSYIKAIDVWMSVCLVFVFVSLLEFAVVNVISRKEVRTIKPVRKPPPLRKDLDPETQWDQINIVENGSDRREPPKVVDPEGKHKARKVDKISRKLFPIAFLLFNIIYWIFYAVPLSHPSKN